MSSVVFGFQACLDLAEDSNELIGFSPEVGRLLACGWGRTYKHADPVLGFLRLATCNGDSISELFTRVCLIRLDVIGSDRNASSHALPHKRSGHIIRRHSAEEVDDQLAEPCSALLKVETHSRRRHLIDH